MFHLMTHAFFKALLFLGAGSVIHALSGEQDIMKMGGLRGKLPWTHLTFLVATLAIAGLPPLAGFFSKDEILWGAFQRSPAFWAAGAAGAFLTAFYMTRLYILTFRGQERFGEEVRHHLHESPRVMTVPLMVLAALSIAGGWVGIPAAIPLGIPNLFEHWLEPVLPSMAGIGAHHAAGTAAAHGGPLELGLMALSVGVAAAGIVLGWLFYEKRPEIPGRIVAGARGLYVLVFNKYFVDELYGKVVLAPYAALCRAAAWFDRWVVDGAVNGAAYLALGSSYTSRGFDQWVVDGLVNLTGHAVRAGSFALRLAQSGVVRSYATAMVLGIFILVSVYLLAMGR
jgi:NADH-quinone oxidoreductase subunit L